MGIIPFSQRAVRKEFFFSKTHIPGDSVKGANGVSVNNHY
jgi:hypothetical protein